jgi:leukotriene-A4 hydrolase
MADILVDTATHSNYADIATLHIAFDWSIDFEAKVLSGSATHDMKLKKDGVEEVMYVSSDYLVSLS